MDILLAIKSTGEKKSLKIEEKDGLVLAAGKLGLDLQGQDGVAVPADLPLVRIKDGKILLTVPAGVRGKRGGQSFDQLREAGQIRQQNQLEMLRIGKDGVAFEIGETIIKIQPGAEPAAGAVQGSGGNMQQAAAATAGGGSFSKGRPPQEERERKRNMIFVISAALAFLFHSGLIGYLSLKDVPADLYDDPTKIPDRFVKLIVDEELEEEVEEVGTETEAGGGEEEASADEQEAEDEGGGGDESTETAAPQEKSREEKRAEVRSKGVLALITSKGSGGALGDVLSSGAGLAGDLDAALGQVSGVGTAGAGVEIRGQRGGGGAGKADIGALAAGEGRGGGLGTKKKKKVVASIKADKFETSSAGLSPDVIRAVVKKNLKRIKMCYDKELAKNPKLAGKIEVAFEIMGDGSVKNYKIASSTMKNEKVEKCILTRIRRFKFPAPDKGTVKINYPFVFTPGG